MKCFVVLMALAAVCSAHTRTRRNPSWEHSHHHIGGGHSAGGPVFVAGGAGSGSGSGSGSGASGAGQQRFRLTADSYGNGPTGAAGSDAPIPERQPIVVEQELPSAYNVNFGADPKVIDHEAHPTELDYFEKPTVINHQKQARLNIFPQQPVVVDTFEAPQVSEQAGPNVISVAQVAPGAGAGGSGSAGSSQGVIVAGGASSGQGGAGSGFGGHSYSHLPGHIEPGHHIVDQDKPGHLEPAPHHKHHSIVVPPPCP